MNANEWLAAFATRIGGEPPSTEEFKLILELAGVAAPAACWVAANAGVDLSVALEAARALEVPADD